jgi:hypothetical protein
MLFPASKLAQQIVAASSTPEAMGKSGPIVHHYSRNLGATINENLYEHVATGRHCFHEFMLSIGIDSERK